jgi:hypothetical protein
MVLMLRLMTEEAAARRHDVCRGVNSVSLRYFSRENGVEALEAEGLPSNLSNLFLQRGPGVYLVEELEQQGAEEDVRLITRKIVAVNDILDQVLTDPVRRTVSIGELETLQDGIIRQGACDPVKPAKENALPLCRKTPVSIEHRRNINLMTSNPDAPRMATRRSGWAV